jgi:hypothetical protein
MSKGIRAVGYGTAEEAPRLRSIVRLRSAKATRSPALFQSSDRRLPALRPVNGVILRRLFCKGDFRCGLRRARKEVQKLGLDPDSIPHRRPA